jgi:hypothetical protein
VVAGWDEAAERFTEPAVKLVVAREVEGEAAPVTSSGGTVP